MAADEDGGAHCAVDARWDNARLPRHSLSAPGCDARQGASGRTEVGAHFDHRVAGRSILEQGRGNANVHPSMSAVRGDQNRCIHNNGGAHRMNGR